MIKIKNYPPTAPISLKLKRIIAHYAGLVARKVIAPVYSMFIREESFLNGVSANILTKNDLWLKESILSIKDYVDEFIIIDSSDENYFQRNVRLLNEIGLKNINHIRKDVDIYTGRVMSHSLSKYKWILHWDGDMVALDSGANNISNLFKRLEKIDGRRKYYEIFFPLLITGSSLSTISEQGVQIEAWVYSNSNRFKWVLENSGNSSIERARFPLFYRKLYLKTIYGLHLKYLFPFEKLVVKKVQYLWMNPKVRSEYGTFDDFFKYYSGKTEVSDLIRDSGDIKETGIELPTLLMQYKGLDHESLIQKKLHQEGLELST